MFISPAWSDETIERLNALNDGKRSARDIAEALGPNYTRNMVISKLRRGGGLKNAGDRKRGAALVYVPRPPKSKAVKVAPEPVAVERESIGISILDIRDGQCRFITSDDLADAVMCGLPAVGPYCQKHRAICFQPPQPRKDAA